MPPPNKDQNVGSSFGEAHGCSFPPISNLSEVIKTSFVLAEVKTKCGMTRTENKEKQS